MLCGRWRLARMGEKTWQGCVEEALAGCGADKRQVAEHRKQADDEEGLCP
jgi:hypothetical protein